MNWDNDELEEVSSLQNLVGSQKGPGLFGIITGSIRPMTNMPCVNSFAKVE